MHRCWTLVWISNYLKSSVVRTVRRVEVTAMRCACPAIAGNSRAV